MQEQLSTSELTLPMLRYGIEHHVHLANPDRRRISGRTLTPSSPSSRESSRSSIPPQRRPLTPDHRRQFIGDLGLLGAFGRAHRPSPDARAGDAYQTQRASSWPDAGAHEKRPSRSTPTLGLSSCVLSDPTPHGTMEKRIGKRSIFKPATHGQFKFTLARPSTPRRTRTQSRSVLT